eukprot:COSAG04_NODE_10093_length_805_cov_0.798867_1_plen_268_part_11
MLLYAITLILRNESTEDWEAEWFPKEGYGWFLVFLFAIVLPSPTVYFYRKDKVKSAESGAGDDFEENPLAIEVDTTQSTVDAGDGESGQPARAKLAKMQREGKDARAQVQKLQMDNQQLQAENQQKQADNQQLQEEIRHLEAQSQMDGDAVRQSESALRKKVAALEAQLATADASRRDGMELVAVSSDDQAPDMATTKGTALKELATDESLSEEARGSAMKALEVLVSSQLAEVEQAAAVKKLESEQTVAVKKRTVALADMKSEQSTA